MESKRKLAVGPFTKEDFYEAVCCGPLCELLDRIVAVANSQYWKKRKHLQPARFNSTMVHKKRRG